jgi:hypothetical protein
MSGYLMRVIELTRIGLEASSVGARPPAPGGRADLRGSQEAGPLEIEDTHVTQRRADRSEAEEAGAATGWAGHGEAVSGVRAGAGVTRSGFGHPPADHDQAHVPVTEGGERAGRAYGGPEAETPGGRSRNRVDTRGSKGGAERSNGESAGVTGAVVPDRGRARGPEAVPPAGVSAEVPSAPPDTGADRVNKRGIWHDTYRRVRQWVSESDEAQADAGKHDAGLDVRAGTEGESTAGSRQVPARPCSLPVREETSEADHDDIHVSIGTISLTVEQPEAEASPSPSPDRRQARRPVMASRLSRHYLR